MGNLQKKCRTTEKKSLAYRGKSGQNTGNDFLALGLGVVLYLPIFFFFSEYGRVNYWKGPKGTRKGDREPENTMIIP